MVDHGIALVGFMGTGKSSVAKILSKELDLKLVDTDFMIEEKMQMKISKIFEEYGEEKFREIEKNTIESIKNDKNLIISCGGGVCLNPENIINLKNNNTVVLLDASAETILTRVKNNANRPILKSNMNIESIRKIKSKRKESYDNTADIKINTDNKTLTQVANEIILSMQERIIK